MRKKKKKKKKKKKEGGVLEKRRAVDSMAGFGARHTREKAVGWGGGNDTLIPGR